MEGHTDEEDGYKVMTTHDMHLWSNGAKKIHVLPSHSHLAPPARLFPSGKFSAWLST